MLTLEPRQTGARIPCGVFTNIGSVGALVCYAYSREKKFALVPIYNLFNELTYDSGVVLPLLLILVDVV